MFLHELPKSHNAKRKRVGRGPGSGKGKTCGRGHKGAGARAGSKTKRGFEGGQTPLNRRLPKFGFTSRNREVFQLVNLGRLEKSDKVGTGVTLTKTELCELGFIRNEKRKVKLLAKGELTKKLKITVDVASAQAVAALTSLAASSAMPTVSAWVQVWATRTPLTTSPARPPFTRRSAASTSSFRPTLSDKTTSRSSNLPSRESTRC